MCSRCHRQHAIAPCGFITERNSRARQVRRNKYTSVADHSLFYFSVQYLILDEADRLLDTEFLSQTQEIVAACTHENVQKAVFSATLPAGAESIAMGMLNDPIRIVVGLKSVVLQF